MSVAEASSRRTSKPRQKAKRKFAHEAPDPALAFMLAQQAMNRWHVEADRFAAAADSARDKEGVAQEVQLAMRQIQALAERIEPFATHREMAVKFEAEEVLAALGALEARMARVLHSLNFAVPWRNAAQLAEALRAKRN